MLYQHLLYPLAPLTWPRGMGWGPRHGLAAQDHSPGGLPLTGALRSNPPCMSKRVGIHLPEYPARREFPIRELGPQDQMWPLPSGGPCLEGGDRGGRHGRVAN